MNTVGSGTLVEALAAWGHREVTAGKPWARLPLPAESLGYVADGIGLILRQIPLLVARIVLAEPIAVSTVEFSQDEAPALLPCNGHGMALPAIAEYCFSVDQSCSGRMVRRLVEARTPVEGPLIFLTQVAEEDLNCHVGPIVVYDGMHRSAAWHLHARHGLHYPIIAHLIKTKNQVSIL
jgi:hypothetical protein